MSDARIAAVVCEGQTDVQILRAMILQVWPELEEVRCLQPELDEMERAKGGGWTQVKSWCQRYAGRLQDVLDPDVGDRIDLLLIAIDVDIALSAGIVDPPMDVGLYETARLRKTMEDWLRFDPSKRLPPALVLSTPVMAIEAWIIAALFPKEIAPESVSDPALWLVRKKKLRSSPDDGKPWKELHRCRDFASNVAKKLSRVRKVCAEAGRTIASVERCRDRVGCGG
jgi:hypothetical protein